MNTQLKTVRFNKTYYFNIEASTDNDTNHGYNRLWRGDNNKLRKAYKEIENISNFYQAKLISTEILNTSEKEVYSKSYSNNQNHGWGMAYGLGASYQSALVAVFSYEAEVDQEQYADVIQLFVKENELEQKIESSMSSIQNSAKNIDPAILEIKNTAESKVLVEKSMFSTKYIISKTKREYSSEANAKSAIEKAKERLEGLGLYSFDDAYEDHQKLKEEHVNVRQEINKYFNVYWKN